MLSITSSTLRITSKPVLAPTQPASTPSGPAANFSLASTLEAVGTVTLAGRPTDSPAGWMVGFVQAEWIETNWGAYRGLAKEDGSSFVQRARPPARPRQACFDGPAANALFYGRVGDAWTPATGGPALPYVAQLPAHARFPLSVSVIHSDQPSDSFAYSRHNQKTGRLNYLIDAQLEFLFCVALAARDPHGRLHLLRGVYWNVRWQEQFTPAPTGVATSKRIAAGSGTNVGGVFEGPPNDPRFQSVLTKPQPLMCNDVARLAEAHPNVREEAAWHDFDVRR